jgi:ATP-binding cassette, subfamily C, bacterial CydD
MNKELFERVTPARVYLGATVAVGLLVAVATVAQMVFLSKIVHRVFVGGEDLAAVTTQILALLGAVAVRAGLL